MVNWRSKSSAKEAFSYIFDHQIDCDVTFKINDDVIGAHKSFLQARSEVLRKMVSKWTSDQPPIPIDNLDFGIFTSVLRYLYTDAITLNDNNAFNLLFAAKVFEMSHLEEKCANFIATSLNVNNVCSFLNQAMDMEAQNLQEKCRKVFSDSTREVLALPQFLELSQSALSAFLDTNKINILEIELFEFILRWAEKECKRQGLDINGENMREVLGDALYKIRFPTMTVRDFSNTVTTVTGLLNDSEMAQIFRKITLFDKDLVTSLFSCDFRCNVKLQSNTALMSVQSAAGIGIRNPTVNANYNMNQTLAYWSSERHKWSMENSTFSLLLQCCSDMLNSKECVITANIDQQLRQDIHQKHNTWHNSILSNPQAACQNEMMARTQEIMNLLSKSSKLK